ncbi:uncharacterized protein LOC135200507 [Macrobrachium nipponense]|uniref:uncharacterized protein LOC135200507 n=1 Tax=Macrobrachium nipponense TaxID=159736 RepID=UPI0030C82BC8
MGRLGGLLACLLPIVVGIASTPTTIGTNTTPTTTPTTKPGTSYQVTTASGPATAPIATDVTAPVKSDDVEDGHSGPPLAPRQTNAGGAHFQEESHHHLTHPGSQSTTQGHLRNATAGAAAAASGPAAQGQVSSPNGSAEGYPERRRRRRKEE